MRKLKLQAQVSIDGFVAGSQGEMDWMTWEWDDALATHVNGLTEPVDCILLGRNMTGGFVAHWTAVLENPQDPSHDFGRKMVETQKVVFSKTLKESIWHNTRLATGDLAQEVQELKRKHGGDIIVYGGAGFVSSLIKAELIDEFNLFVNPAVLGEGMTIFRDVDKRQNLKLLQAIPFDCGIVGLQYQTVKS